MKKYANFLLLWAFWLAAQSANAQVNHLVISQVFGGGGNTGAPYNRDYVELFNPTNAVISLTGLSLQYASASGTSWTRLNLTGSVAAGHYFLIQMTQSGATGSPLPTPDLVSGTSIDMSASSGKLVLLNTTNQLSGTSCTSGPLVLDLLGFGSANCAEGSAAPAGSNTLAVTRLGEGCTDFDVNSTDFTSAAPNPRNSASAVKICGSPGSLPVHFSNFRASARNNGFELSWTNEIESEVQEYRIEGSEDGILFIQRGRVTPTGNIGSPAAYRFLDSTAAGKIFFYRIKAVELDGKLSFTPILRVRDLTARKLTAFPNPARNEWVWIQLSTGQAGIYRVRVVGTGGQVIWNELVRIIDGQNNLSLRIPGKGLWRVQVEGGSQSMATWVLRE